MTVVLVPQIASGDADDTFSTITVTGLTSGRVPFVSTGGLIVDSANFTYVATIGSGGLTIANTTASTTTATGAAIIAGGLGVGGQATIGSLATAGVITSTNATDSTSISTGSIIGSGGMGLTKALWVGGLANIAGILTAANTTDATSISTGSVITPGGLGVTKALWVGGLANIAGVLTIPNTTGSTSTTTGAMIVTGGVGIGGGVSTGSTIFVSSTAQLFRYYVSSGGVDQKQWDLAQTADGVLSLRAVNDANNNSAGLMRWNRSGVTAGTVEVLSATDSSSTATGGLVLTGGLGVAKKAYFGDKIVPATGSTTIAPIVFTAGTNLTTAVAGGVEFDGVQHYHTIDTSSGRGAVPVEQYFHLTAAGSAISTIANFFGATSNIALVASAHYEIEAVMYFTNATAGTVTWTLTNSAAPTGQNIIYEQSPITGIVALGSAAATEISGNAYNDTTAALAWTSGTLTDAVVHYARIRIQLINSTGTSLKIQATKNVGGTITPGVGSFWRCRRISPNNIGIFVA